MPGLGQNIIFFTIVLVCRTATTPVRLKSNDIYRELMKAEENENWPDLEEQIAQRSRQNTAPATNAPRKVTSNPVVQTTTKTQTKITSSCSKAAIKGGTTGEQTIRKILRSLQFLKKFNYLSSHQRGNHELKTAVEIYQRYMHLPVTGRLDNDTIVEMNKPRCGVPDLEIDDSLVSSGTIRKRFAVSSTKWLTLNLTYAFENYTTDMTQADQKRIVAKAFKMWSDVSPFIFTLTTDPTKAQIKLLFTRWAHPNCKRTFDGPGGVIGHAWAPPDGRLHFDDDDMFTDGVSGNGKTDLLTVAVHEIGHILGIAHSTEQNSIMYPAYVYRPNLQLHADDINAIQYKYAGGTAQPNTGCTDESACQQINYTMCFTHPEAMKMSCPQKCQFC